MKRELQVISSYKLASIQKNLHISSSSSHVRKDTVLKIAKVMLQKQKGRGLNWQLPWN